MGNWIKRILERQIKKQTTVGKCERCSAPIVVCDTSGKLEVLCDMCKNEPEPEGTDNV